MTKYISRLVNLGVGKETTRGTQVDPTYHVPKVDFSFDDKVVKAREMESLGKIADSDNAFVTTQYGQGDVGGEIRASSFGLFLYAMLGTVSSSGVSDSAYTHSFTVANTNTHQSLSFVVVDPNTTEEYQLVMLDSLEITAELDEIVKYKASFMSKKGDGSSRTVPAVTSEYKFTKKHLSFKVADTIGGLAAASSVSLKSLTLTISKNVVLDDVLGTAEPEDILNRQLSIEGQLKLNYEDETWKNYMRNGTDKSMEIKLTNTDTLIGVTSRPTLTFQMPKVDFFDWEPDYSLDDITTQTISFKAKYDVANAQEIITTCSLINAVASY